jgi:hypothetical protein
VGRIVFGRRNLAGFPDFLERNVKVAVEYGVVVVKVVDVEADIVFERLK